MGGYGGKSATGASCMAEQITLARNSIDVESAADSVGVKRASWATAYLRRLTTTDTIAVVGSLSVAQIIRFGTDRAHMLSGATNLNYTAVSALLMVAWLASLAMFRSRDPRVVGGGADEYRRVAHASMGLFGLVAIVAFLFKIELARGYLAVALPLGLFTLVLGRWSWRRWLMHQRRQGRMITTVIVVGSHRAAATMANSFEHAVHAGYRVVGVCIPGWGRGKGKSLTLQGHTVPVLGDETAVVDAVRASGADMVAVSNTEYLGAEGMRALAWDLEAVDVDMVVSAGVAEVAGPRLHMQPVAGLPLLHVEKPRYRGANELGKNLVDFVGAALGLAVLSPLLLLVALAVKLDSRGPVFYRAERIGLNGKPFPMMKFRSMVVDAHQLRTVLRESNEGSGPLFKMRNDPRVTRVGRWLRRMSIDELPQLFNVVAGQMSIVGPRPPLRAEVRTYTGDVHRRLLVKPGITGLWQVSGRSNLSWEESVRLDLYYVENWSMIQDLIIIWRTVGAVLKGRGAY